ncbi:DUF397 domain-containing protein [Streptomyces sp. NPDC048202]|uniref:DUF397 domain-containing protein n=1 Tax=Streptomyces sp. NPDC048202 TaxID=3365514 RepID=UPI00371C0D63
MSENRIELKWFKSSYSGGNDGNSCVEVARAPRAIHVRDSKQTTGPQLALTPASWAAFVTDQVSEPAWFKSTYSSGTDGNSCVEVAVTPRAIRIRDSKQAAGPQLALAHAPWATFVQQAAGLDWFKSSHSGGTDGNSCVEVALAPRTIHIRDSKQVASGPRLAFAPGSWAAFITVAREEL